MDEKERENEEKLENDTIGQGGNVGKEDEDDLEQPWEGLLAPTPPRRDLSSLLFVLLGVITLGFFGWLIFKGLPFGGRTHGSLSIESTPPGATIYLNKERKGETPLYIVNLKRGKYRMRLEKEGFGTFERDIEIKPNQDLKIAEELLDIQPPKILTQLVKTALPAQPIPINASITDNNQVKDARLFFKKKGRKRFTSLKMTKTKRGYSAVIPGRIVTTKGVEYYIEASDGINTSRVPSQPQEIRIKAIFGALLVESSPSKARVWINNVLQKDLTPIKVTNLEPKEYRIKIAKKHYRPWNGSKVVRPGSVATVSAKLKLIPGKIKVTSTPSDARVFFNGKLKGKTPITIDNLTPWREYDLEIRKEMYSDWVQKVFTEPGEITTYHAVLKKKEGTVYIYSVPPGASVYLDNKLVGKTPIRDYTITLGKHDLRLEKEGYQTTQKPITITKGKENFICINLEKKE